MDMYQLKFTRLQNEIMRYLSIKSGMSFNLRGLARPLKVSLTAVSKALKLLKQEELVKVEKDPDSKRLSIELNKKNPDVFALKRIENLKLIYESGLVEYLSENFPGAAIILFGSYSFGEDTVHSDIDIAIVGSKEKDLKLSKFDKMLERTIFLHFYNSLKDVNKNLRANILSGITLEGAVEL